MSPATPAGKTVTGVTVNGKAGTLGGMHHDAAVIAPHGSGHFEVIAKFS